MNDTQETHSNETIVFAPTTEPAVRSFIIAVLLLGFGAWCWFDKSNYPPPEAWTTEFINDIATYTMNHWGPFVFVPVGAVFLALGIRHLTRKMVADSEGLGYSGGEKILWSNVTAIDASALKEKGLLKLTYNKGKRLILDSYKLQNFRELVGFVERRLPELAGQAQATSTQE